MKITDRSRPKFYILFAGLFLLMAGVIPACSKSHSDQAASPSSQGLQLKKIFAPTFAGNEALEGIAYRPSSNCLYMLKYFGNAYEILHYNLTTGEYQADREYNSLEVYGGIRCFNDSLYVIRPYDEAVDLLAFDKGDNVFRVRTIAPTDPAISLRNCSDVALSGNTLHFINGAFFGGEGTHGILSSDYPYNSLYRTADARNPDVWVFRGTQRRSMVRNASYFIVSPGTDSLELYDNKTGHLVKSIAGPAYSYLQQDSERRVYAIDTSAKKILRWQYDLSGREEFPIGNLSLLSENSLYNNENDFVVIESKDSLSLVVTNYRRSNPIFYKVALPK